MKNFVVLFQLVIVSSLASCEEVIKDKCKVDIHIVDDAGNPVGEAQVAVRYPVGIKINPGGGFPTDRHETSRAASDAKGNAVLEYETISSPEGLIWVKKNGSYESIFNDPEWKPNGTKSWATDIQAILKPIKNAIPMYAHAFGNTRIRIPKFDEDYGYDLELLAFVPPHGNGKHSDIIFHVTGSNDGKGKGQIQMTVRGNGEKTGFVEFLTSERERGSIFISDYTAPAEGYANSLSFKFDSDDVAAAMSQRKDQNYYFRVRCQLNPDGSIKSCHYGKLYGPFTFWNIPIEQGGVASFGLHTTYFNPTANDSNVEFDTKRNLLPDGNVQRP